MSTPSMWRRSHRDVDSSLGLAAPGVAGALEQGEALSCQVLCMCPLGVSTSQAAWGAADAHFLGFVYATFLELRMFS